MKKPRKAHCSFCRKSYRDVGPLVEGEGNVYICAECIELCQSIIVQEKRRRNRLEGQSPTLPAPELLCERLNSIFGTLAMDTKSLADAVISHYGNRSNSHQRGAETNILLVIGPSSSKAILLARALAHVLDVPFARGNAKNLTPRRAVAETEESIFYRLLRAADFEVEAAQRGIVLLDGMEQRDAQEQLVELLKDGSSRVKVFPQELQFEIASILFVCFGNYLDLDEQITRHGRHPEQPIRNDDLLDFGVVPAFVRHLRAIVRISRLDDETVARLAASADLQCFAREDDI
jgi:ATP-dependent Clp protease ATP-binding subunit ClpX